MYGTHVLLHISLFLFFWALSDFFSMSIPWLVPSPATVSSCHWRCICAQHLSLYIQPTPPITRR